VPEPFCPKNATPAACNTWRIASNFFGDGIRPLRSNRECSLRPNHILPQAAPGASWLQLPALVLEEPTHFFLILAELKVPGKNGR
jgi:hypothetical protein